MSVIAESFIVLKRSMLVWDRLASRGLVSVAPKNVTPTMVVSQSKVPIKMMLVANNTSFLTIFFFHFLFQIY